MLRKLRRRIVCMLMAVVLLIMAAVVTGVYLVTQEQMAAKQINALQHISQLPFKSDSASIDAADEPDEEPVRTGLPFFCVRLSAMGKALAFMSRLYPIDEEEAVSLARRAVKSERNNGILRSHALRYLVQTDGRGHTRVTFISTLESDEQLQNLLVSAVSIYLAITVGVFFLVMFPLAHWLTRPVEEAWSRQKRFIADASHELKTPLTVLLANLSILQKQCRADEQRPWLESSAEEAERMKTLIDEMLCLARAEDAQSIFHPTDSPISDMLEQLAMAMEPAAYDNGAALSAEIEDGLRLRCDVEKLRHAVQILLENAIQYAGRSKQIRLTARQDRKTIQITVYNDGEVIAAEALPHLFERFYRADATRAAPGYGLGLAIAKQWIELHHGSIEVQSVEGEGTTFVVRVPAEE